MNEIESNVTLNASNENEISLIDLLAVLIRYRKSILITVLIFLVSSCTYFFISSRPPKNSMPAVDTLSVTYSLKITQTPQKLSDFIGSSVSQMTLNNLNDKFNFARIEKKYNIFTDKSSSDLRNNEIINNFFKKEIPADQKNFYIISDNPLNFYIVAKLPENRMDDYRKFIAEYISSCIEMTNSQVNETINPILAGISDLISKQKISDPDNKSDLSGLLQTQSELNGIKDSCAQFITLDEDPFELVERPAKKSSLKKIIIITLAGFFFAIFIAFLRNAIENIKKDPKASKIIQEAWSRK